GEDVVEEAAIRADQVHVELLALERAYEGVRIERPVLPERLPRVQDRQVESGGEEVAGREVEGPVDPEQALRQRPRLVEPVVAVLVGEGHVRPAQAEAELAEDVRHAGGAEVPPAVLERLAEREVVVEGAPGAAQTERVVPPPEAPGRDLGRELEDLLPAPGDQVDGAAERIAPEEDRRAADHLDPVDVAQGNQ